MRHLCRVALAAAVWTLCASLSTSVNMALAQSPLAVTQGDLAISPPWSRATPASAPVAGGYFAITNKGATGDRLISATTGIAAKAEVHEMATTDGVMTMRQLTDGLPVPANGMVELKPGGFHIMFMGLKQGLKEGDTFKATLQFEKAGPVEVTFTVGGIAALKAPQPMAHDHMH